jgi:putative ABC transport system permease protein
MIGVIERLRTRTPIGWLQLSHSKARLAVAVTGIAFANVLVLLMWGMNASTLTATARPIQAFKADIFVLSPEGNDLNDTGTIPRRRLDQALTVPGVRDGSAVNIGMVTFRNPSSRENSSLTVFGLDPEKDLMADPAITAQRDKLKLADTVLLDRAARGDFRSLVARVEQGQMPRVELVGRTVSIEGLFSLGGSFTADGVLIASDQTFMRLVPRRSKGAASFIGLQVEPGADPERVAADVRRLLPASDTRVFTSAGFQAHAQAYQQRKRPIGILLLSAMLIAFVVGTVIVYQILSADVADHLAEYATFKAMGFTDLYLLGIIFEEAIVLAILGFIPGLIGALIIYEILANLSGMPIFMPVSRAIMAFGLTLGMCAVSGAIATRKLAAADPADIFG